MVADIQNNDDIMAQAALDEIMNRSSDPVRLIPQWQQGDVKLELRPVMLTNVRDRTLTLVHRIETSRENGFSVTDMFNGDSGWHTLDDYFYWLEERKNQNPYFVSFATLKGVTVGQLEMCVPKPQVGYICLIYILPQMRGVGLGRALLDLAEDQMRLSGMSSMQLSSMLNREEMTIFYSKCGWTKLDSHPDPVRQLWEKRLDFPQKQP